MENKKELIVRLKVPSEIYNYLKNQSSTKNLSNVISRAVEFYYDYLFYRKGFLIRLIEINFLMCKNLLRKIGRSLNS